ncbi:MAG: type III-B CRISPR-associated protein Cas10/Cmr2 [Lachnospiraceae bacterium]|nr:type III-B CRISPR-associated protein Cas10/Cmr2 [Lachnospiraceae bacterium]
MNKRYIGITIGPIFDTICDATSPAALWFSSFFFSNITKSICDKLSSSKELGEVIIYSPYYNKEISLDDGVGKFHDRIICSITQYKKDVLDDIITNVKKDMIQAFPLEKLEIRKEQVEMFLNDYLQILYVVKEDIQQVNCVLELSPYLDAIELMRTIPKNGSINIFHRMFMGDCSNSNRNLYIKESKLFKGVKNNPLVGVAGNIKSIEDIANDKVDGLKYQKYFAVVSVDGDNMGGILQNLRSDEEILEFSKLCLEYAENASKIIKEYGGMTIYAGGDDLLFLAPVQHKEKNIFNLCNEINNAFDIFSKKYGEIIDNNCSKPTVSIGISIQYYKHPLYEAINCARELLWRAKENGKNRIVIDLRKHSGQSIETIIKNDEVDNVLMLLEFGRRDSMVSVQSLIYVLNEFRTLINIMNNNLDKEIQSEADYTKYESKWCNLFDNSCQEYAIDYIKGICRIYYDKFLFDKNCENTVDKLLTILRIKKFLLEKEGI